VTFCCFSPSSNRNFKNSTAELGEFAEIAETKSKFEFSSASSERSRRRNIRVRIPISAVSALSAVKMPALQD